MNALGRSFGVVIGLIACWAMTACGPNAAPNTPPRSVAHVEENTGFAQTGAVWVELGTQSGPIPSATRSEPAHLLLWRDQVILVDAGDGVSEQLAKAGVPLNTVTTIFISHLHFDHTGGLFGLLGMRYQAGGPQEKPLTIYGPPGTAAMIAGLRAAMQNGSALTPTPLPNYTIVELNDQSSVNVGGVRVTAAANSHYDQWPTQGTKPVALSYRFDAPGRAIVYTGDTGPSENVVRLAHGADLLVSEVMDADAAVENLKRSRPDLPFYVMPWVRDHFTKEHLVADQVGLLAQSAGVRALVLTHFGGDSHDPAQVARLTNEIAVRYHGPVTFAADLQRF